MENGRFHDVLFESDGLTGVVVSLACLVLVCLFALQRFGTHRVAFMFAPIVISWLLCIFSIGIYNICHWNHGIVKGLSPYYIYNFFKVTGKDGWMALGGVVLCITGESFLCGVLCWVTNHSCISFYRCLS